jgi:hypothetical protein
MKGVDEELKDQFESSFLQTVDSKAADALAILERDDPAYKWNSNERSAWTRFILALMFRMPEDVQDMKALTALYMTRTDDDVEALYAAKRTEKHAKTFAEYLKQEPHLLDNISFEFIGGLMNLERVGRDINNFNWHTLRTLDAEFELLTSDRPLLIDPVIGDPNARILLPIGPRRIFVGMRQGELRPRNEKDQNEITFRLNKAVVEGAVRYVYGTDDRQLRFVQNRMGISPEERSTSRLLRSQRGN